MTSSGNASGETENLPVLNNCLANEEAFCFNLQIVDTRHFAHTDPHSRDTADWEPLYTGCGAGCAGCEQLLENHGHLQKVSSLTVHFAEEMFPPGKRRESVRPWAYQAGLWHDLGKFSEEFQEYLRKAGGAADPHSAEVDAKASAAKVDHSTAGAQFARKKGGQLGCLLSYILAGHHSGLSDGRSSFGSQSSLEGRLNKTVPAITIPEGFPDAVALPPPPLVAGDSKDKEHRVAFFLRMLFSALVDADFLATEAFMSSGSLKQRPQWPDGILSQMLAALNDRLESFPPAQSQVNLLRAGILQGCIEKAKSSPGLFSLTVPTGGGKTLSSMAFALNHALVHDMRRVIYVIPFTSIIEQNADVFREIFRPLEEELGQSPVLEHHSNLDPAKDTTRNRLASENWDAPLVITTNVQFLESLFANRTSRCRKLHRVARSVIIFDEAQNLPVSFLAPCLSALRILIEDYGCSLVLCTATQPAVVKRTNFPIGLPEPKEIIDDVTALFDVLKRTEFHNLGALKDDELLERLRGEKQSALTIVNTRRHAASLFRELMDEDNCYHLSGQMCPEHRSETIREIRQQLNSSQPCRVISTQLIEAGVDLDFAVVYRALAGIDSIAQAAGRCNREGRLPYPGQVYVFNPEAPVPPGHLRYCADCARGLIDETDLLSPEILRRFFEELYWKRSTEWDQKQILANFQLTPDFLQFQFRTAADNFRLIDQEMSSILVPWGAGYPRLVNDLKYTPFPSREVLRKAQRLSVQVHPWTFAQLLKDGFVEPVDEEERFFTLTDDRLYHPKLGLLTDSGAFYTDPEKLML